MGTRGLSIVIVALWTGVVFGQEAPLESFTTPWREDSSWADGRVECAVYEAARRINGVECQYQARLHTHKELADPHTKTRSVTDTGREAFKHHLREDLPTGNRFHHYSTMVYVGVSDLKSLKIDMGSQEESGTTFKQFVNHAGEMTWHQFSCLPGEGYRGGASRPGPNLVFHDALSLVLRGYPFEQPTKDLEIALLPDQTSNHWTPAEPRAARVQYLGRETLTLPIGRVDAHHLRVLVTDVMGGEHDDYWFSSSGQPGVNPPGLFVLVQYQGRGGASYRLRSLEWQAERQSP